MKIKHVLLIDDNQIDNYISKTIITRADIAEKITEMQSGVEAIEYLKSLETNMSEFPDAIFLDINMPEMDGFGFLDEFQKLPYINKKCVVYMLTSSTNTTDVERAMQHPIVKNYFNKPLKLEVLAGL